MDLLDLEMYIQIAEQKSMNKAAQSLFLAQSSVHKRMQKLETELGQTLITRLKTGVDLTSHGQHFYKVAKQASRLLQSPQLNDDAPESRSIIKIGIAEPFTTLILPTFIKTLDLLGKKDLRVTIGRSNDIVESLIEGSIDIGIVNEGSFINHQFLDEITLFEEPLSIISNNKYQQKWQDLSMTITESTFILPERGMPLRDLIEKEVFEYLGIRPKKIIEVNSNQLMKEFVRAGDYLTFIPLSSLNSYDLDKQNPERFQVLHFNKLNISQRCVGLKAKYNNHAMITSLFQGLPNEVCLNY